MIPEKLTISFAGEESAEYKLLPKEGVEKMSDGYHTFDELYEHRHILFANLCNLTDSWKSRKHSDGTMYDGWFIAGIGKTNGKQITYHIPLRLWDEFKIEVLKTAPEWDGHTSEDVLKRLSINPHHTEK